MKNANKKLWVLALILIVVGAALQSGRAIEIFGVRPNLFLAILLSVIFFIDSFLAYAGLVLIGTVFLRFGSGLDWPLMFLTLIVLFSFWLKQNIVWPGLISSLLFIVGGTVVWYLVTASSFLFDYPGTVVVEVVYNLISGLAAFSILALTKRRLEQ